MAFDPKDLENLAAVVLKAGAPILGGLIGGPFGAIIGTLVPQIASAFGLAPDTPPAVIAATVQADPAASDKLAALESKQRDALAWAQLQVDQNNAELAAPGSGFLRFFYGAWRPSAGWLFGPIPALYQLIASAFHLPLLADGLWTAFLPVWIGLAGLRTYERYQGVALDTLPVKPRGAK